MSLNYSCNDGSVLSRFQVRFVESEFKALRAFVSDLALLLQFLREEAAPTSPPVARRNTSITEEGSNLGGILCWWEKKKV